MAHLPTLVIEKQGLLFSYYTMAYFHIVSPRSTTLRTKTVKTHELVRSEVLSVASDFQVIVKGISAAVSNQHQERGHLFRDSVSR